MKNKKFAAAAAAMTLAMSVSALAESYTYTQDSWWTAWTPGFEIADGATVKFTGSSSSSAAEVKNWYGINSIFTNVATDGVNAPLAENYAGYREYVALRADNWGWGDCYNADNNESSWDWDNYAAMVADCSYDFVITRSGRTVTETINITGKNGVSGWQKYTFEADGTDPIYVFFTGDETVTYTVNTIAENTEPTPAPGPDEPAPTGDFTPAAYLFAALALSGAALMLSRKKENA
jgi:hypothetical protein